MRPRNLLVAMSAVLLASCTGEGAALPPQERAALQLNEYCDLPNLARPSRQTILIIDETAIVPAGRAEMLETNRPLFELVRGLAESARSSTTGAMAPREHFSLYAADRETGDLRLLVSGCPPTLTAAELRDVRAARGGMAGMYDFMGASPERHAREAGEEFRNAVIARVNDLGQTDGQRSRGGTFEDSNLLRALRGAPNLTDEAGVTRLFIYTDLNRLTPQALDVSAAREAGFAAARTSGIRLHLAQVHLVGAGRATPRSAQEFADAFVLGSQGRLMGWGAPAFNALPTAPDNVRLFSGEIDYPPQRLPMSLRLATDQRGRLVDSWITITSREEVSTPVTGALICDAQEVCRIVTDEGGLAQVWTTEPGGEAEFGGDLPLGGLRHLEAEVRGGRLTGAVSDPAVTTIGPVDRLRFEMVERPMN